MPWIISRCVLLCCSSLQRREVSALAKTRWMIAWSAQAPAATVACYNKHCSAGCMRWKTFTSVKCTMQQEESPAEEKAKASSLCFPAADGHPIILDSRHKGSQDGCSTITPKPTIPPVSCPHTPGHSYTEHAMTKAGKSPNIFIVP